jgi:hypothetical protein
LTGKDVIGSGEEHQLVGFGERGYGGHSTLYFTRRGLIFHIPECMGFGKRADADRAKVKKRQTRYF